MINKSSVFNEELTLICNEKIRISTTSLLDVLPDYFYTIPASSTGKYHPQYVLGKGGLVKHVKATVVIAMELFKLDSYKFSQLQKDIIISSLLLHDGLKNGNPNTFHTVSEHPVLMFKFICSVISFVINPYMFIVALNILTHMGQWNKGYHTNKVIMPVPFTKMQKFVHLCDYLASRKFLEVKLDGESMEHKIHMSALQYFIDIEMSLRGENEESILSIINSAYELLAPED